MWFRSNASVVLASISLALLLASPLGAQQGRWEESISRSFSFQQQGNYAQAVQWAQEALRAAEATFGSEHINVATSLNALAVLYKDQGKYAEAEPLFRRALAIWEKVRGSGKYAEAEPLYHGALAVRERALGAGHLDVANLLNNLAQLCAAQGRYADAEPLYQRSLAIREKTLGSEHSFVADSLNNLAGLYKAQGKRSEEHTSELQSRQYLVCRLLLEKKKQHPVDRSTAQLQAIRGGLEHEPAGGVEHGV